MLSSKLDSNTLLKWEEYRSNLEGDVPTLEQFYKFMIDRADVLESLNRNNRSDVSMSKPSIGLHVLYLTTITIKGKIKTML